MKLNAPQLPAHLDRGLKPLYWLHGDEPYARQKALQQIKTQAKKKGFTPYSYQVGVGFDWSDLLAHQQTRDLFTQAVFIHLHWQSPQFQGTPKETLTTYLDNIHADCCLCITSGKLTSAQSNTKLFKAYDNAGVCVPIWPVTLKQFPNFVQQEAKTRQCQLTKDAVMALTQAHAGHCFSAAQALDRLALMYPNEPITATHVQQDAAQGARYTAFEAIDATLLGQAEALKMWHDCHIQGLALPPALGALMKTFDELSACLQKQAQGQRFEQICDALRIWPAKRPIMQHALKHITSTQLKDWVQDCVLLDSAIKQYPIAQVWQQLERLVMRMVQTCHS